IGGQTDSQAVQITAAVTGTRSINAMNALATLTTGADAATVAAVKEAGILTGIGTSRPTLQTAVTADLPIALAALGTAAGGYVASGTATSAADVDLSAYDPAAVGSSVAAGTFANPANSLAAALLLLGGQGIGAFRAAGLQTSQAAATRAYSITRNL
ncbi:MAG TPA: hypothetical protein VE690_14450, partial [Rhodopila sp.]|nr:hypothetical protein [Rhodopila sp.]